MAKYMRKKEKLKSQKKLWNGINSTDLNPSIINNGWTFFWFWLSKKIVLVGDSYAGKTSVVYRMVNHDRELPDYIPTVMKTEPVRLVRRFFPDIY